MPEASTPVKLFSCTQSTGLAEKIAESYGSKLGNVITSTYSDGEFQPSFEESIRGSRVFIIGSTHPGADHRERVIMCIIRVFKRHE